MQVYKTFSFQILMDVSVIVTSEPKGLNPGGRCLVESGSARFPAYFKFCRERKITGASSFRVSHQPIYEALTFKLVRNIGLTTTDFYVLLNRDRNVHFYEWKGNLSHDPSGRDYYFVSKILPSTQECPEFVSNSILQREAIYLNSLLVADVIGRKSNYHCRLKYNSATGGNFSEVVYLDLGCSFVYASKGQLSLPGSARYCDDREFRIAMHRLERSAIVSRSGASINLAEMVAELPNMEIPTLNPHSTSTIDSFLDGDEIREIQGYLAKNLADYIGLFRSEGLLDNGNLCGEHI